MIKVLHISKYFYPYHGGIEDVCLNIVNILSQRSDIEQMVFCFNDIKSNQCDYFHGVLIERVGVSGVIASQPVSYNFSKELKKVIEKFIPDYIHFHAPNPLAMFYLMKLLPKSTKLIIHWHSDIVDQKMLYKLVEPFERKFLKRADKIIVTSSDYAKYSLPLSYWKDKIVVIANIIDPDKFELTDQVKHNVERLKNIYANKKIVLFVGRHVQYKGLEYLLEAVNYVQSDCYVIIGGVGPLTDVLKKKTTNTKIKFIDRIADDQLVAYYYAADIFAFPSITKNEAFGVVLAEAMYCLTPCITFVIKGSGVNWVSIGSQTGIEVANKNSKQFAAAIDQLLNNEDLRIMLARNAKRRVSELFIANGIKERLYNLYQ